MSDLINIDFDRTLTDPDSDEWSPAHEMEPNEDVIEHVRELYFGGHNIIIWTARQWSEASNVIGFLEAHEVPYHGLRCSKGGSDLYVDDKALRPDELLDGYREDIHD